MTTLSGFPDAEVDARRTAAAPSPRRVRHEVRDGLLLMGFSAAVSCGAAGLLALLSRALG